MTINEIYTEAIKEGYSWLTLLIEVLVFEKKVVHFDDEKDALDLYFKPNNQPRMNQLLHEYRNKVGEV